MVNGESNLASVYQERGYALIKNVVPPEVAGVFLSITQKAMGDGRDAQARFAASMKPLSKPAYDIYSADYPAALTFLWALTPFVESVIGKSLLPTYSFFRVYQKGGVCMVHSDRPSCEHSMSLTLGASDDLKWPFTIGQRRLSEQEIRAKEILPDFGGDGFSALEMEPGDAVLYQGVHYRHGRLAPNPNRWSAHMFLHWVDRDGPFKEFAFDKKALPRGAEFKF
jgi:hypothetical protein